MRATNDPREQLSPLEVHIDTRQVMPGVLRAEILRTMGSGDSPVPERGGLLLEEFRSFRESITWGFNRLYWHRLADWEQFTGRGYEQALPGGKSDANHPSAVADCVADFWTLIRDLDSRKQLRCSPREGRLARPTGFESGERNKMTNGFYRCDENHPVRNAPEERAREVPTLTAEKIRFERYSHKRPIKGLTSGAEWQ